LHKAVLFYQPKIVKLIADKFRISTRAKDQVKVILIIIIDDAMSFFQTRFSKMWFYQTQFPEIQIP